MSDYPDPRRVILTYADLRALTILERARACAIAGVSEESIGGLMRAMTNGKASPDELETGATLLYAMAYQLERRRDPSTDWEDAQTWAVVLDLEERPDPIAEVEARASVEASIATGLPPDVAGELTLAQVDAYGTIRKEQERTARTRRRRR